MVCVDGIKGVVVVNDVLRCSLRVFLGVVKGEDKYLFGSG